MTVLIGKELSTQSQSSPSHPPEFATPKQTIYLTEYNIYGKLKKMTPVQTVSTTDPSPRPAGFTLAPAFCFVLIVLAGLLAYGLSLNADFYMDDYLHIVDRPFVKGEPDPDHHYVFRLVPFLLYRGIYAVAGPSAFAFHLLNLVVHLGAACALFVCGRALLRNLGVLPGGRWRDFAAFAGALVFAVHPFASEAVNYARCSMIGLVTLFTILSTWSALRWLEEPRPRFLVVFAASVLLGTFSKEVGVFHIGFNLALVGCLVLPPPARSRAKDNLAATWASWPGRLAMAAAGIAAGYLAYRYALSGWAKITQDNFVDNLLTQGRVIWGYFAGMVAPAGMLADHQIAWSRSAADTPALVGLVAMLALAALALAVLVYRRTRPLGVLLAMLLFPLYLRLLYPIFEHFVEYRAYPALPWFALIVGAGIGLLAKARWKAAQWALTGLVLAGATFSALRSAAWSDAGTLAYQSIGKYPFNNRARTILQRIAYRSGEYEEVLALRGHIHAVYSATMTFNASNRWGREYDLSRANFDLVNCEQLAAYAIAELHGSEEALEFVESRIAALSEHFGPFQNEKERERALGSLLVVREVLVEHGGTYDRGKGDVAAAGAAGDAWAGRPNAPGRSRRAALPSPPCSRSSTATPRRRPAGAGSPPHTAPSRPRCSCRSARRRP